MNENFINKTPIEGPEMVKGINMCTNCKFLRITKMSSPYKESLFNWYSCSEPRTKSLGLYNVLYEAKTPYFCPFLKK